MNEIQRDACRPRVAVLFVLTALVLTAIALAGCTTTTAQEPDMSAEQTAQIKDELRAKGPVEEEVARLEPLLIEMADAVVAVVPGRTWTRNREERRVPCEAVPGDRDSASARVLPHVVLDGPIPDALWDPALARVREIASRVGADELIVRVDRPGHHDIQLVGPDKVQFGMGTETAAVLVAQTGCHLNPSDEVSGGS